MTDLTPTAQSDDVAVRDLIARSQDAWNRGDGVAYGACFTTDATDVTFVGTVYRGGAEIGRAHQALFDSFLAGTRLHLEILDVRRYGADTAVIVTRGDVAKKAPRRLGKLATYVVVRDAEGDWRIAAVQKTQHKPLMEAISFRFQPATRPGRASAPGGSGK
ncbi:SgcJ/EcaC family oxidoreductase [Promicromonospora sp. NPDC057138]|uniref:SgcJ/EcaC family oxidoreductase n=1 Tax=Promicromonospora sp. NPDC057138 TaxID=3346031 RepID=UPI00362524B9